VNVKTTGAKVVKRWSTTQDTRAMGSKSTKKQAIIVRTVVTPFLKVKYSVVNAILNCLRNVRKNLDVGMIATVLRMPRSACLVLSVKRRVKRRAKNTKSAYVNFT
jgi:hypothetical protein